MQLGPFFFFFFPFFSSLPFLPLYSPSPRFQSDIILSATKRCTTLGLRC